MIAHRRNLTITDFVLVLRLVFQNHDCVSGFTTCISKSVCFCTCYNLYFQNTDFLMVLLTCWNCASSEHTKIIDIPVVLLACWNLASSEHTKTIEIHVVLLTFWNVASSEHTKNHRKSCAVINILKFGIEWTHQNHWNSFGFINMFIHVHFHGLINS